MLFDHSDFEEDTDEDRKQNPIILSETQKQIFKDYVQDTISETMNMKESWDENKEDVEDDEDALSVVDICLADISEFLDKTPKLLTDFLFENLGIATKGRGTSKRSFYQRL